MLNINKSEGVGTARGDVALAMGDKFVASRIEYERIKVREKSHG
jgi:hypothetical protein